MSGRDGKNELIFDDVQLEPNTMMTVYHCPVAECAKRNYLDAKSVRTHCRRFHSMLDYEPIPSQAEAQFICQVIIITIIGTIITKKVQIKLLTYLIPNEYHKLKCISLWPVCIVVKLWSKTTCQSWPDFVQSYFVHSDETFFSYSFQEPISMNTSKNKWFYRSLLQTYLKLTL